MISSKSLGAIIAAVTATTTTTATADSARAKPKYPRAHYFWCTKRYDTYHFPTNTFVDREGKRVQCISPYIKRQEDPAIKKQK